MRPSFARAVLSTAFFGTLSISAVSAHAETEAPSFSSSPEDAEEVVGEIVVDVKDDLSDSDIQALGAAYGIALRDNSPGIKGDANIAIANVDPAREDALIDALSHDPRVEAVEREGVARVSFVPNDPKYTEQWHMARVGAEKGWEYACGMGVTVAIIDTGVACYDKAPFMKGTDLAGTACEGGYDFVSDRDEAADDHGHGTHVAGTVAQTTHNGFGAAGLAFCATLMPVKVLSRSGSGTMADVAEGIRFAASHGAQVINLSLGSPMKSRVVESAVRYAYKKGVVVVAAAGNSGRSVGYPAAYPEAIAVSATDRNDNLAWFSSRGPQVAIGAPGVAVTQQTVCQGGRNKCEQWGVFNGTSMASPHVAGAAALLVGMGISDPDAVRAELQRTAIPKEDANLFGAGILDAAHATSHAHWSHVAMRVGILAALFIVVARRIQKKGGTFTFRKSVGLSGTLAALFASVGLAPWLPLAKLSAVLGASRLPLELLIRPFGEWDILYSANLHKWLLLASALPALALTVFFLGVKSLRPVVGGFALGAAALLGQLAYSADVAFPLGSLLLRAGALAQIILCLWIARIALDAKKA